MPLLKVFSRVDEEGKIPIPSNIRRFGGFTPGDRVEIRLQGPHQRPWIVIQRRSNTTARVRAALPAIPVAHY